MQMTTRSRFPLMSPRRNLPWRTLVRGCVYTLLSLLAFNHSSQARTDQTPSHINAPTKSHPHILDQSALHARIERLIQTFDHNPQLALPPQGQGKNRMIFANNFVIEHCDAYPYHNQQAARDGFIQLKKDIQAGLRKGLQCMAGLSDQGALHPYHREQAVSLIELIENQQRKTFRCVRDEMHAFGVANTPSLETDQNGLDKVIRDMPYPSVVLDTYRISGFISDQHPPSVYRDFFKMNDQQIARQLAGQPEHIDGLHRYNDRPGLVFHEMLHWLGHEHTNLDPDPVFLYETCCFGGSDFIKDEASNTAFQQRACAILRDQDLWEANQYKQMRVWRYKDYDELKRDMREKYAD